MNLADFITETLVQIINGVKKAQEGTKESGAAINPVGLYRIHDQLAGRGYHSGEVTETVEFDEAVTVEEGTIKEKGGGLVSVVSVGAKKHTEAHRSSISRIKFSVQALLPPGETSIRNQISIPIEIIRTCYWNLLGVLIAKLEDYPFILFKFWVGASFDYPFTRLGVFCGPGLIRFVEHEHCSLFPYAQIGLIRQDCR